MSKSLQSDLMATAAGAIAGTGLWLGGIDAIIWPAHPLWAELLLTLVATVLTRELWLKHVEKS
jgi:hypothetical protein